MNHPIGLLGNLLVKGTILTKTGLHVGASQDTVEIGGIDSPVIKNPRNGEPYIPGSSLKGKMRSFMEKITYAKSPNEDFFKREKGPGINQHECCDIDFSYQPEDNLGAKSCPVCRVYGSTGKKVKDSSGKDVNGRNHLARIVVRDCSLKNELEMKRDNLYIFEAKMENAIDRMTSAAHPRTFERVPEGAEFNFEIIYKVQGALQTEDAQKVDEHSPEMDEPGMSKTDQGGAETRVETSEQQENGAKPKLTEAELEKVKLDMRNIFEVLSLIQKDGLGGSVSRGYGQIVFKLDEPECLYYPVGGDAVEFLPAASGDAADDLLEKLRTQDFSELDIIINGNETPEAEEALENETTSVEGTGEKESRSTE